MKKYDSRDIQKYEWQSFDRVVDNRAIRGRLDSYERLVVRLRKRIESLEYKLNNAHLQRESVQFETRG